MEKQETIDTHDELDTMSPDLEDTGVAASEEEQLMLTTVDNPYNPKTDYEKWRLWDADHHYHTEEYLARITNIPEDVDIDDEIAVAELTEKAIQEILEHDVLGTYMLV